MRLPILSTIVFACCAFACADDADNTESPFFLPPQAGAEGSGAIPSNNQGGVAGQDPSDPNGNQSGATNPSDSSQSGDNMGGAASGNNTNNGSGGSSSNMGSNPTSGDGLGALGAPCNSNDECAGGLCLEGLPNGYCTNVCTSSSDCDGGLCFGLQSIDDQVCFLECQDDGECRTSEGYICDGDNTCFPGGSGGGPSPGDVMVDVGDVPEGPVPNCDNVATWQCTDGNCGELIQVEPRVGLGYNDYGLNGETLSDQYRSWARRDLLALVTHAADMVSCLSQGWAVGLPGPLGLGDMSEADGAIPGTRENQPGHPANTHTDGFDMDIAYYMLIQPQSCRQAPGCDDCHCLSPVCEHRVNGQTQYHCVEEPSILDVWRSALFLGYLHASPQLRVIGVDGKIGPLMDAALDQLCANGWLDNVACNRSQRRITYETTDMGYGWYYFHHHHLHISITGNGRRQSLPVERLCLTDPCVPMSIPHHDPRAAWVHGGLPIDSEALPFDGHRH